MKKDFNWLVSELARRTMDSEADSTLDLSIARASRVVKALREIARFAPDEVAAILGIPTDEVPRSVMPPLGICLPCVWVSCRGGDTVNIRLLTGQQISVELMDCHAPYPPTEEGRKATHFLESLFETDGELRVWFSLMNENDAHKLVYIMQSFAFETATGRIYIGTEDVSGIMVRHGHATTEKCNG